MIGGSPCSSKVNTYSFRMLQRQRGNLLDVLLKECYTRRHCQNPISWRTFASGEVPPVESQEKNIAVLGGGITGLASTFYLSEAFPKSSITLYEGSSRLGGWLHSTSVDVGNGQVVFEQGPRNLRPSVPNGMVTLDLVRYGLYLNCCRLMVPVRFNDSIYKAKS